jgi:hypothetical protein
MSYLDRLRATPEFSESALPPSAKSDETPEMAGIGTFGTTPLGPFQKIEGAETHRRFRLADPEGGVSELCYAPSQTLAQVRAWYPDCQVEPLPEPTTDTPIPADVAALVTAYLDRVGEDDPQTRHEALTLAASRRDIAQGYRDRAVQEGRQEPAAPSPPEDLEDAVAEAAAQEGRP